MDQQEAIRILTSISTLNTQTEDSEQEYLEVTLYEKLDDSLGTDSWRKWFCQINNNEVLCYSNQGNTSPDAVYSATYCCKFSESAKDKLDSTFNYDHKQLLKVYTCTGVVILRAESTQECDKFVKGLCTRLMKDEVVNLEMKRKAEMILEPFLVFQLEQHHLIKKQMEAAIMKFEDINHFSPLRSLHKLKEGYLRLRTQSKSSCNDVPSWKQLYFVLTQPAPVLYWYTKALTDEPPDGMLSLNGAIIKPSSSYFKRGRYVIHIQTPYRHLLLEAKHISCLRSWLETLAPNELKTLKALELSVDQNIQGNLSLSVLLENRQARESYMTFLGESQESKEQDSDPEMLNMFRFFRDVTWFMKNASFNNEEENESSSTGILNLYIAPEGERSIHQLQKFFNQVEDDIEAHLWNTCFLTGLQQVETHLEKKTISEFRLSRRFHELMEHLQHLDKIRLAIKPLFGHKRLVLKEANKPKKVFVLDSHRISLGRDMNNDIVIDDIAVSRTHCEIMVDDMDRCIVFDLGSTSGTKINGKHIIRHGLNWLEEVNIGSTLFYIEPGRCK